ncbi:hypothetical protein TNCV_1876221 [Trichonephila clavipes]|nr:hypothetical protein TNCV_1876221 [Trichonephila clavipes]
MTVPRVPTCGIGRDVSDQVGVKEKTSESLSIRGASRFYLAAIFSCILERILYRNSINLSDWSRVSGRISSHGQWHPPSAGNSQKTPLTMMYLWVQCLLPGVGTRHPFRWGKRRTQQIPFVVNNNRADIKITVAIPRDRRPPITQTSHQYEVRNHFFSLIQKIIGTTSCW